MANFRLPIDLSDLGLSRSLVASKHSIAAVSILIVIQCDLKLFTRILGITVGRPERELLLVGVYALAHTTTETT